MTAPCMHHLSHPRTTPRTTDNPPDDLEEYL